MSDIIVISEREEVISAITSISEKKVKIINSSEKTVSFLKKNKVGLVILDLDTPDLNIFVAHELLKTAKTDNEVAVIIIFSESKVSEIDGYKKLLHPPDEFIKESEILIKLNDLFKKYYKVSETVESEKENKTKKKEGLIDTGSFVNELSDEIDNMDIFKNDLLGKDDLSQGVFIVEDGNDHSGELDISIGANAETKNSEIQIKKTDKVIDIENKKEKSFKKTKSDKEEKKLDAKQDKIIADLKAEIISLQKQNEFIVGENKELIKEGESIKNEIKRLKDELDPLKNELEKTKLATKELIESKDREIESLKTDIEHVKSDKKILESSLMDRIGILKNEQSELEENAKSLKSDLETLQEDNENLKKELDVESKKNENLKKELESIEKAKDEKEKILITSIDHLKKSIASEEEKNAEYKGKLEEISELSENLSKIIKDIK